MSSTYNQNKFIVIGIVGIGILSAIVYFTSEKTMRSKKEQTAESTSKKNILDTPSPSQKWAEKPKVALKVATEKNLSRFPDLNKTFVEYSLFKRKVLKSESEKRDYKNLFNSNTFLAIKNYLSIPESNLDIETNLQHQIAISLLKEGLKFDKVAATRAALDITLNQKVEDKTLSKETRQLMAKDKAELMYHFSALSSEYKSKIKQSNLGPVTQNVFENVLSAQKLNLAESAKAVAKFNLQSKQK